MSQHPVAWKANTKLMAPAQPKRDLALGRGCCCLGNLEGLHHTSSPHSTEQSWNWDHTCVWSVISFSLTCQNGRHIGKFWEIKGNESRLRCYGCEEYSSSHTHMRSVYKLINWWACPISRSSLIWAFVSMPTVTSQNDRFLWKIQTFIIKSGVAQTNCWRKISKRHFLSGPL